ncbi:MAG: hypothetical protein N2Z72_00050 [Bacteroidales bacterium]|nr:hypothetical protein [Bacteroidales bacterium]
MKKQKWILLLTVMLFFSCVKEEFDLDRLGTTDWNPNVAAPLINTEMSMWDVLMDYDSNEVFVIDSNKLLYLVYDGYYQSPSAENFIQLSDQFISNNQNLVIPGGPLNGLYTYTINTYIDLSLPNGIILDSVFLKQGTLQVNLNSTLNYPSMCVISFGNSTQNGQPFADTLIYTIPSGSSSHNLTGTKLVFDPNNPNRLPVNITLYVQGNGNPNLSPYFLNFAFSISNLRFSRIHGYLGQFSISNNMDTLSFRIYNSAITGIIYWEDPRLYINLKNSFGIPFDASFIYLATQRTIPPYNSVNITGPGIPNPWHISFPSSFGQTSVSSLNINKNNSNLSNALAIMPQKLLSVIDASANPNGNIVKNFALDTSRIHIYGRAEFPFFGYAHGFVLADTIPITFPDTLNNVEWILFRLYTKNGFPVDANIQLYFLDSLNHLKDSLISSSQTLILSAFTSGPPDYIVTQPQEKMLDVVFPKQRVQNLLGTRKVIIKARLNTQNSPNAIIKIYAHYRLKVRLSMQVQFKFSSNF